jgi:hypothetical protein
MLEAYNLKILERYEMHEAYKVKSLKDILSNKNSDMVLSNLGACGIIALANIFKDLRRIHICPYVKRMRIPICYYCGIC